MAANEHIHFRHLDLVEDDVLGLRLLRPREADALISEDAFAQDEFLPYWAELWPSAIELAQALPDVSGLRVVELGCGLGLPSLAAAKAGASVLATDWSADAVALLQTNAARNGIELEAEVIDWRRAEHLLERAPFDLVLAADVLYERRYVELLLELLPRLGDTVLLAEPGRPFASAFLERAAETWDVDAVRGRVLRLRALTPRRASVPAHARPGARRGRPRRT
jgi:predicted nicotinamide N-methyase